MIYFDRVEVVNILDPSKGGSHSHLGMAPFQCECPSSQAQSQSHLICDCIPFQLTTLQF